MDVRAAVVAATQDELIENGYDALSAERIAERTNLEPEAVRERWRDADELIALVFDELGEHEVVLLNTGSLETDLRALAAGIAAFHGVPRLRATFQALVYSAGRSPRAAESLRRFWAQRLVRAAAPVRRAIADGDPAGHGSRRGHPDARRPVLLPHVRHARAAGRRAGRARGGGGARRRARRRAHKRLSASSRNPGSACGGISPRTG